MFFIAFAACAPFHLFVEDDTATDTAQTELTPNPTVDIDWLADHLAITITNGQGYAFEFGLTESSQECSIDTEYGCWTGEDCFSGYVTPQGTYAHISYCHPLREDGGELEYSTGLIEVITGSNNSYVIPGTRTAFPSPNANQSYEFEVTYFLRATSVGSNPVTKCWAWGKDPDHFLSLNCTIPLPIDNTHLVLQEILVLE